MPLTDRNAKKQAERIYLDITDDNGLIRGSAQHQIEKAIKRIWKNGFNAGKKKFQYRRRIMSDRCE